jgi:alkanesulfonate monooxygenase SsuD/methylene tetrahydromethanopterin reductase-like flavin-dependent oxidoreductase (luciferase family)
MIIDTEFNSAAQIPSDLCLDAAVLAEARGFGCIWKGESNSRDPMVLLSAMAVSTHTVQFGTAIYHIFGRSPVTLAAQAATFNELSGGRLILGLGVGNPTIAAWHGSEFDRPLARLREYVQVLRAAYSGDKVEDIAGDFYSTTRGFRLAFRPPEAPLRIWIAGLGPQMARLAGAIADGIIINLANPTMIEEIVANFHDGARRAGRNPASLDVVSKVRVSLHEDPVQARWALKKVATFYSLQDGYSDMLRRMGWGDVVDAVQENHRTSGFDAARRQIPDDMIDDIPMYAAADMNALPAKLAAYAHAGSTRCVVAYVPADNTKQWSEIDRFIADADFVAQQGAEAG